MNESPPLLEMFAGGVNTAKSLMRLAKYNAETSNYLYVFINKKGTYLLNRIKTIMLSYANSIAIYANTPPSIHIKKMEPSRLSDGG